MKADTIYGWWDCCGQNTAWPHKADCILDTALTKAGLPDQESRDAARKEMEI